MAINKPDLSKCEELNLKVYTLYKHTGWGYGKIASKLGLPKSDYLQLPWPSNLLDLNPIENLWLFLKQRFMKHLSKKEHRPHGTHELFVVAHEEWEEIDQGTIDDLIDSMPRRIQAVIEADGDHTKW